jgi:hypothetical protein
MDGTKYLFIDGGYIQRAYRDAMERVFGLPGELSVQKIIDTVGPFRTYYYDCVDEKPKDKESQSDFERRVAAQNAYTDQLHSLTGVQLRLGTLAGRTRRQKEVDVLLAVDMLTHGFSHNMSRAALLSGDLDFRPVVEALVRGGVFVEVWYEKTSGSKELYWAADQGRPVGWSVLHSWSIDGFLADNPLPEWVHTTGSEFLMVPQINSGVFDGGTVELMSCGERGPLILHTSMPDGRSHWLRHNDRSVLVRYFAATQKPVEWTSLP